MENSIEYDDRFFLLFIIPISILSIPFGKVICIGNNGSRTLIECILFAVLLALGIVVISNITISFILNIEYYIPNGRVCMYIIVALLYTFIPLYIKYTGYEISEIYSILIFVGDMLFIQFLISYFWFKSVRR